MGILSICLYQDGQIHWFSTLDPDMAWVKWFASVQANDELRFCEAWLWLKRELEREDRHFDQIGKDVDGGYFLGWLCALARGKQATR